MALQSCGPLSRICLLRNDFLIPQQGSNGVWIDLPMVQSVHGRLKALEQEEDPSEALNILYNACNMLIEKKLNTDLYPIQEGRAKDLLQKHNIFVNGNIEPRLIIVFNCLNKCMECGRISVVCPLRHD